MLNYSRYMIRENFEQKSHYIDTLHSENDVPCQWMQKAMEENVSTTQVKYHLSNQLISLNERGKFI